MDLLALASASEEPGVIIQAGKVPSDADLAKVTGIRKSTLQACIKQLEERGVFSRDERGAIYSRRMKREAEEYRRNSAAGARGGNPMLLGDGVLAEPQPAPSKVETGLQHSRSNAASSLQQSRSEFAEDMQQTCNGVPSNNNTLDKNGVIPPVKADSDSDKEEEKKKENPDGFETVIGAEVVSIEEARLSPKRRGTEAKKPSGSSQQLADEDRALQLWNILAAVSWVAAGSMTPDRRAKLRRRLREGGGLAGWQRAVSAVEQSPLWQGRQGRGWKPTFDDILSRDKFRKLLEGGYPSQSRSRHQESRPDPNADLYSKHGLKQEQAQSQLTIDMEDV